MTRYPKSGKGRKWTVIELKSVPAEWRGDTLSDGDGLSGEVRVSGVGAVSIRFKYAFKWQGKVAWFQAGTWPALSMESIRESRDNARNLLKTGVNPNDGKKAARFEEQTKVEATLAAAAAQKAADLTISDMFDAWLKAGVVRKDGNKELLRSFKKDVLPAIGIKPVREIAEDDLRKLLADVVKRGSNRMAIRVYEELVQMFAWAELRKPWRALMSEGNATRLVEIEKIVPTAYFSSVERERILSDSEIQELHTRFREIRDAYSAAAKKYEATRPLKLETQLALWICLSTGCRIGELLMTRWEHVDFDKATWRVPVENVKKTHAKQQDHVVFLSAFAQKQFEALKKETGHTLWCFPSKDEKDHVSVKTVSKQVGDRQTKFKTSTPLKNRRRDNTLVLAKGKNGEWTPHDLRRTAATLMQRLGVNLDVIDRCQGHVLAGSRVRRHYLHHDYADEKREAWSKLGTHLQQLLPA